MVLIWHGACVVYYAQARGIRVIPEIDTPGHVWAGLAALDPPVLTTYYGNDGGVAGTGPLDASKESTFVFLQARQSHVINRNGAKSGIEMCFVLRTFGGAGPNQTTC